MDILSDVNVVGKLTTNTLLVSSAADFRSTSKIWQADINYLDVNFYTHFKNPPSIITCVGENGYYYASPDIVSIDVPANCQKFVITGNSILISTACINNFDDVMYYPSVTAWCCGKKIEMDLELCLGEKDSDGKISSEFVIGSVTPSSSERNIRVILY